MAFDPGGGGGTDEQQQPGSSSNDKKKVLRRRTPGGTPSPQTTQVGTYDPNTGGYGQVGLVDAQSYRLLPSEVVLDIAGLGLNDNDIVRAARMLAAQYDVNPRWVFGVKNPRAYLAKQTGKPVTLRDMHRITDAYAPAAVAAMLEEAEIDPGRKVAGADAKRIGQVANLLAREYGGLDIATGIALAQKLVLDGITPKKFEKNYTIARQWAAANGVMDETVVFQAALAISHGGIEALVPQEVEEVRAAQQWAIDQGITTREQIERLSADNEAIARATGDSTLLAFNQDYWAEVQRASARVQLTQDAFSRSIVGKTLGAAGTLLTGAWQAMQVSLIELGTDLVTPAVLAGSALGLDPQGDSIRENWDMLRRMRTYATQRINMGDTVGDLVEEGYTEAGLPLPDWTSTAFDFAVGWYVDPFVVAGKVGRVARGIDPLSGSTRFVVASKTMPRLDESLKLTEKIFLKTRNGMTVQARIPLLGDLALSRRNTINDALAAGFNKYVTKTLPNSRLADKLYEAAYKSNHAFFRELDLGTPGRIVGRALDYEYMKFVRSKLLERFPTASKEAREAFGEALTAHFVGFGPEGSIAEAAVAARIDRAKRAVEEGVARGAVPENELPLALSEHLAAGGENAYHIPFTLEGPSPRGLYGPRRLTRRAMTSQTTTQYALGRRFGNLRNINPGRVLNPHDLPDEYILMHSRRWNVFDEREVRAFQSRVNEITARGGSYRVLPNGKSEFVGMETALAKLVDEINDEAFKRIIKPYNLSDDASKTLYDSIFGEVKRQNYQTQTFLVTRRGADDVAIEVPQLETQLRNSIFVVDPITVRSAVREYTGFGRRANAHLQKSLKGVAPEIAARVDRNLVSSLIYQTWGHAKGAGRFYQRMWKGLTVARPGYIPRVILGDENARFMVTTRSFTERLLSQEWFGLTSKLDDAGWFDEVFTIGDDTVRIGLPGAYERNALASGTIRQSELITEMMRDAQGMFKNLTPTGSWKPLRAVDGVEIHAKAWEWVLQKQFAKSRPGQIALESVARGDDITATREALIAWAKEDKFVTLRTRIGVEPNEFDSWFTDVANAAHAYTMQNPAIATAALAADAKDLRKLLNGTKIDTRPVVHGPGMDAMLQGDTFTKGLVNRAYDIFVRKPEDVLNRQPFYKTWKRRAEVAYTEAASRVPGPGVRISYPDALAGSAVRNADGTPIRVYHGTTEEFGEFSTATAREGIYGPGLYFAEDPTVAGGAMDVFGPRGYANARRGDFVEDVVIPVSEAPTWEDAVRLAQERLPEGTFAKGRASATNFGLKWKEGEVPRNAWEVRLTVQAGAPNVHFSYLDIKEPFDTTAQMTDELRTQLRGAFGGRLSPEQLGEALRGATLLDAYRGLERAIGRELPGAPSVRDYINRQLQALGYDGVFHVGKSDGRVWVAFNGGQVLQGVPDIAKGSTLTPALTQAIDTASTQFALEQVRRVMFDLTRQSRFTELLQFIFPFPQPFFEGFQTWGAIAMRNPEGIGRIMQLFRTGVETGFIRKDEQTGEYVVGMDVFRRAMPILHALGIDESGRVDKVLSTFVAPLTSFNMLASTTIKFGPEGFVGKVIGGVPIPVPGMHVPASLLLQNMFADSNSIPATSYLFQYGPSTTATLLPTQVKLWLSRVMPEQFPDKQAETLAYSILRSYQVQGLDVDDNGNPIPLEELERMALEDAKELAFVRGFLSLLSPASLRVKTAASPYEAEWQELVSSSESYFAAIDEWNEKHPDLSYVPIGKTFYDAGFTDPATGAEANAPRLPTSAVVAELLSTPGIGDFMKANPQWAGLVLIGLDPEIVEAQDFATYSRLLSNGMLKYKPIANFLAEADRKDGVVWNEIDRWYRDFYDPQYTNLLDEGGLDEEDPAYRILRSNKREFLTMIATQHPGWAKQNLQYHEDGEYWDWPGGESVDKPIDLVLADARRILDTPGFQDAPGFQALGAYLDLHDEYVEKMRKRGFYDIFQDSAQEDGLTAAYAREVKAIIDGTPGIDAFLASYFGVRFEGDELLSTDDLRGVTRDYDISALGLSDQQEKAVTKMNMRYEALRDAAQTGFNYTWERSERYNDAARYFDRKFFNDRETFDTWWELLGRTGQEEYKSNLVGKPAVFYSAFDLHLSGVNVTPEQAAWLSQIADARVQIAKNEEENPEYSESSGYEAINKQVRAWMSKDPKFADVIAGMNSWTLALRTAGYDELPGKTGHIWSSLLKSADDAQAAIDNSGVFFTGADDYDTDNAAWWDAVQDVFIGWVEKKAKVHKPFAETWDQLTKDLQDPIVGTILVPDNYYPMGRVED